MYDSETSANELLINLKKEIDASKEIPLSTYVRWLNSLERFIYRAIVKEQICEDKSLTAKNDDDYYMPKFESVALGDYKFRDILAVYYHYDEGYGGYSKDLYPSGIELLKVNKQSRNLVDNCFYENEDGTLGICLDDVLMESCDGASVTIAHVAYPEKKSSGDSKVVGGNVMIPLEFIGMVEAKIRYEAYMLCEEPSVAANWLNIYNTQLEDFKIWHELQARRYGS